MGSTADADDSSNSALSPAARGKGNAGAGAGAVAHVRCAGVAFTVTDGNEVAEVVRGGGAARVLASESFFDAGTGLRRHFVDVEGKAEAMLFYVSVNEDLRRIVDIRRFS
ncbi:unnamed protein product [Urochloa humidicola]